MGLRSLISQLKRIMKMYINLQILFFTFIIVPESLFLPEVTVIRWSFVNVLQIFCDNSNFIEYPTVVTGIICYINILPVRNDFLNNPRP